MMWAAGPDSSFVAQEGPGREASPILTPACGLGRSSIGASRAGASTLVKICASGWWASSGSGAVGPDS
eukprot:15653369-Heterocapsa_arctica.AAC.1